jgi:hypothetical protein
MLSFAWVLGVVFCWGCTSWYFSRLDRSYRKEVGERLEEFQSAMGFQGSNVGKGTGWSGILFIKGGRIARKEQWKGELFSEKHACSPETLLPLLDGKVLLHVPGPRFATRDDADAWVKEACDLITSGKAVPLAEPVDPESSCALAYYSAETPPGKNAHWPGGWSGFLEACGGLAICEFRPDSRAAELASGYQWRKRADTAFAGFAFLAAVYLAWGVTDELVARSRKPAPPPPPPNKMRSQGPRRSDDEAPTSMHPKNWFLQDLVTPQGESAEQPASGNDPGASPPDTAQ